tara:strand:+ start:1750 stop:3075 length:1326 start_codon:yes stop_codon:yes gene_type:complete
MLESCEKMHPARQEMVRLCLDLVKTKMAQQQKGLKNSAEVSRLSSKLQAAMAHPDVRFDASVHGMSQEMREYIALQESMHNEMIGTNECMYTGFKVKKPKPNQKNVVKARKDAGIEADNDGLYHWEHLQHALAEIMGSEKVPYARKISWWIHYVKEYVEEWRIQANGFTDGKSSGWTQDLLTEEERKGKKPPVYYLGLITKYFLVKHAREDVLRTSSMSDTQAMALHQADTCVNNFLSNRWIQIYYLSRTWGDEDKKHLGLSLDAKINLMKGMLTPAYFMEEPKEHWEDWARSCFFMTNARTVEIIMTDLSLWWSDLKHQVPSVNEANGEHVYKNKNISLFNQNVIKVSNGKYERVPKEGLFTETDRLLGMLNYHKYVLQVLKGEPTLLESKGYVQLYNQIRHVGRQKKEEKSLNAAFSDHMTVSDYTESMRVCNRFQINL